MWNPSCFLWTTRSHQFHRPFKRQKGVDSFSHHKPRSFGQQAEKIQCNKKKIYLFRRAQESESKGFEDTLLPRRIVEDDKGRRHQKTERIVSPEKGREKYGESWFLNFCRSETFAFRVESTQIKLNHGWSPTASKTEEEEDPFQGWPLQSNRRVLSVFFLLPFLKIQKGKIQRGKQREIRKRTWRLNIQATTSTTLLYTYWTICNQLILINH